MNIYLSKSHRSRWNKRHQPLCISILDNQAKFIPGLTNGFHLLLQMPSGLPLSLSQVDSISKQCREYWSWSYPDISSLFHFNHNVIDDGTSENFLTSDMLLAVDSQSFPKVTSFKITWQLYLLVCPPSLRSAEKLCFSI